MPFNFVLIRLVLEYSIYFSNSFTHRKTAPLIVICFPSGISHLVEELEQALMMGKLKQFRSKLEKESGYDDFR